MKKTIFLSIVVCVLSITTIFGGVFTYKYFDLKGNNNKKEITKSDVSYACSCVMNDFESEGSKTDISFKTRSENLTAYNIPANDYTTLTNDIIDDFYDKEIAYSFVNQYYEFIFKGIFEIAVSQNYVADKKFKPVIGGEEKDYYAYVTVDDCIMIYLYSANFNNSNKQLFEFFALDYDFENDGYSFTFYRNLGGDDIATFYVEKDNALIDENYDIRSFTRFSGIRTYKENEFDYLIDYDFVNKKVYECWEGTTANDKCNQRTYLDTLNSDSVKFQNLYNNVFSQFTGWDLKVNEYFG